MWRGEGSSTQKEITYSVTPAGCWECTSHKFNDSGYPIFQRNHKKIRLSRYMYEKEYGTIPQGMLIRHKCDNPHCINPEHLEIGTHHDNHMDMVERGRSLKGVDHPRVKLSENQVLEIRASGESCYTLAARYGVAVMLISKIKRRLLWKHL
jgi:hypothetical protein